MRRTTLALLGLAAAALVPFSMACGSVYQGSDDLGADARGDPGPLVDGGTASPPSPVEDGEAPPDDPMDAVATGDGAKGDSARDARRPGPDARVDARPDAPPPPFNPSTWSPPSKGLWIWYWDYIGMNAKRAAERAKEVGVSYVLIKSGQDGNYWSDRYNASSVREFTSRGIRVFAWPYVTPRDIDASVDAVVKAANVPGTDGIVLDVEIEWERGNHADEATELCKGIRAKKPGVWLGYTSWGWVGYHGGFPFAQFDKHCGDAYFPQVYWSDRGVDWRDGYDEAISQLRSKGLKAPVWIVQSNDDIYGSGEAPATGDLNAFFDIAGKRASLWEFPGTRWPGKLKQLGSLHWKNK